MGVVQQHSETSHGHIFPLEDQDISKQLKQNLVNYLSAWSEERRKREWYWHFHAFLLCWSTVISGSQATFLPCYNENGKRGGLHISLHLVLLFSFSYMTLTLTVGKRMQQLFPLSSFYPYIQSRRESSALTNDCSMERKGQQSQEHICHRLIMLEIPKEF